jgi:hypothetical protein
MMKLMKYELIRRRSLLIGTALAMILAEAVILYGIYKGGSGLNTMSAVLTVLLTAGAFLLPFLDTIAQFYSDFKHKHGFMLFMTPNSGYSIVWSKVIFAALELLASVALLVGCLFLSYAAVNYFYEGALSGIFEGIWKDLGTTIPVTRMVLGFLGMYGLQLLAYLSIAVLALTVTRIMMPRNSYHWLVALLIYFALSLAVGFVNSGVLMIFGLIGDIRQISENAVQAGSVLGKYFAIGAVTYFLWFIGCNTLSGRLVDKNLDL